MALFRRKIKKADRDKLGKSSVTASTDIAIRPQDEEFTYLKETGAFFDIRSREEVQQLREKLRRYSVYDSTMSTIVNLTSMFVTSGAKIVCEDQENEDKLNAFFKNLNFEDFLHDFIKEYLISGEATSFASWNDEEKTFTSEQVLNPDQIEIKPSLFKNNDHIIINVPDKVKEVFDDQYNPEHDEAVKELNDVWQASQSGIGLNVDSDKIMRIVNRAAPWDDYGVPMFAPALSALVQKESLDAALYEQLTTLITPTIIGTVGLKAGELGQNVGPWIPTQGELDQIKNTYKTMMMAKFRLGLFSIGVDFKNAFAGASIPDLNADYQRCDQQILRCVAAGRGLLDGSSGGPFASNAINRDVYSTVIQSLRTKLAGAFQKRIDYAIKKLNILAYRSNSEGRREKVVTSDGRFVYETAFLDFDHGIMRNANDALQVALQLANADVPISKQTLADMVESGLQIPEELRKLKQEDDVAKKIGLEKDVILSAKGGDDAGKEDDDKELKSPLDSRNF